ncbi:hypothetical protein CBP51_01230 [Cellvibrio mixtus]|uniref:Uncharacterized protein n=1 Tax=Cellvibrio mixtus TaxID=39650 RepID=A0A266Q787_9GAMM|nr:hypothetical protein [Cellvibrio mixtus]OZY85705.1 hypothetical protein CBP51_01230 [Cellvibrio mixtus]
MSKENWEDTLNPEIMRERLISISMYITAFELLRETIIDNIRSFYAEGYDQSGPIIGKDYQDEVLARNKSEIYASLDWLVEHEAIDIKDIESFEKIKKVRNRLAHELLHVFTRGETFNLVEEFNPLIELLRKIGVWWVVNVEIPTNPDYDGQEIDESGIVPGGILSLQIMLEVVSGNSTLLEKYREARNKGTNKV